MCSKVGICKLYLVSNFRFHSILQVKVPNANLVEGLAKGWLEFDTVHNIMECSSLTFCLANSPSQLFEINLGPFG